MKIDFHIHSIYSFDSGNLPKTIIEKALGLGISIAITDHDSVKGWKELEALGRKAGVEVILGEEVRVFDGKEFVGEILGLFLNEKIHSKNFFEVIDEIHSQGGLCFIAHPFDFLRNKFKRLNEVKEKIDGVEAFNARSVWSLFNKKAERFAEKNDLCKIAGSDAHFSEEIGKAFTEVKAENLEDVRRQLKKKNTKIFGKKSPIGVHLSTTLRSFRLKKPE